MLRYGVIVGHHTLKAWELACVKELRQSRAATLDCALFRPATENRPYDALCKARGVSSQSEVPVSALKASGREHLSDDPTGLDFLLLFGDPRVARDLIGVSKYGIWYFLHGEASRFSSEAPGFWEIYHDYEVTGATLLQLLPDEGLAGVSLREGYFPTIRESFRDNVDTVLTNIRHWPVQVCREIGRGVSTYLDHPPLRIPPLRYGHPTKQQTMLLQLRESRNKAATHLRNRFFSIDWHVGRLRGSASDFINRDSHADTSVVWSNQKDTYLADPCVLTHGEKTYVFCEQYRLSSDHGILVAADLPGTPQLQPEVMMRDSHHLSYPHVFEHGGEIFCIPESGSIREVSLFRCVEMPTRWEYVRTLIKDFAARDSTLVQHAGKWWLFCTSDAIAHRGYNSHLYIWYADDLLGEWKPHARNPVKIDARSARPAGRAFLHDGHLYRPAQDCSRTYGGAIRLNRIDVLTPNDFKETVAGIIRPPKGLYDKGIHTVSNAGDWCLIDAKRYVFRPLGIIDELKAQIKRVAMKVGVPERTLLDLAKRVRNLKDYKPPEPVEVPATLEGNAPHA